MRTLAISFAIATAALGCSSGGGGSAPVDGGTNTGASSTPDLSASGKPAKALSGEVAIKNLGFSGDLRNGLFTFVIENGKEAVFDTLTELKIATTAGDLVYPNPCGKLGVGSPMQVMPGSTSSVIKVAIRYATKETTTPTVTASIPCESTLSAQAYSKSNLELSSDDHPVGLTLAGVLTDASPWSATASVR